MPRSMVFLTIALIVMMVVVGQMSKSAKAEMDKNADACRASGGAMVYDINRREVCVKQLGGAA